MMNRLGKGLVLANFAVAMLAFTWAALNYLQFTDLGWKEAKAEFLYHRIPSELDKRGAALFQAYRSRDRVLPTIKPVQEPLNEAMNAFVQNRLFYVRELNRLRKDPNAIVVKGAVYREGILALDPPDKSYGKPLLETPYPDIVKSYESYEADLEKLLGNEKKKVVGKIQEVVEETNTMIKAIDVVTEQLNGEPGKNTGLYHQREYESGVQTKLRDERADVEPRWADTIDRERIYSERYQNLYRTKMKLIEYYDALRKKAAAGG